MNSYDSIRKELNDLGSTLPTDKNQPVFTVPEGYFENLAASLLATVNSQTTSVAAELEALSPVLAAIPKNVPFGVPENYFTHLATGLPALVNEEALPEILQTHTRQMPYAVPAHYFDDLAAQVTAKVTRPKAKIISLPSRVMRIAAAAVVAGIIAIAGIWYVTGNRTSIDPVKQPQAWVEQKLKNVPKKDIETFLKTVDPGFGSHELAQQGGKSDVRQLLRNVSTTELDAFLSELPADTDFSNIN